MDEILVIVEHILSVSALRPLIIYTAVISRQVGCFSLIDTSPRVYALASIY